jgi:hypothetical protein
MDGLSGPPGGVRAVLRGDGSGVAPFPLPPTFPPGVNPEQYQLGAVSRMLKSAAYLPIFSVSDPARPNIPIPSPYRPDRLIGVEVREDLHRFEADADPPAGGVIRTRKQVGEPVASVGIRWMVAPDDFEAAPGRTPPPTELDPTRSQRFVMLDGRMSFKDRAGSGFRAFGTGRTFPALVGGRPQLRIGAVITILEGFGGFQGLPGTVSVNGYIQPPTGLALNFILRVMDPDGRLRAASGLRPLRAIPDPDPDTAFLVLLGEPDPGRPTTLQPQPDGRVRASVHERLRLVGLGFDLHGPQGVRSRARERLVVGTLSGVLHFNPNDPNPVTPIQTTDGLFTFCDRNRPDVVVGTLAANVIEGRGFRTPLAGAPMPVFRFGGFGPFLGGTGPFRDAVGMMSLNAAISVFPRTLSNLYVLRVADPDRRFRPAERRAWS